MLPPLAPPSSLLSLPGVLAWEASTKPSRLSWKAAMTEPASEATSDSNRFSNSRLHERGREGESV